MTISRWQGTRARSVLEDNIRPPLEGGIGNVQPPINCYEEHQLILVDLRSVEARDLTPRAGRVVPVLEVFRGENQSRQEHAPATLHSPTCRLVPGLLLGEILIRHVRLDLDQIIQGHLQSAIASARPPKGLLDEGAKGQDAFASGAGVTSESHGRQGPDNFNDLRRSILNEQPLAFAIHPSQDGTYQRGCQQN